MRHLVFLAGLFAAGLAATQVTPGPAHGKGGQEKDPVQMLKEIEQNMGKVEELLLRAQAGQTSSAGAAAEARAVVKQIEKLLDQARKGETRIIDSLDELIKEIRKRQKSKKRGGKASKQNQKKKQRPEGKKKDPRYDNQPQGDREDPRRKKGSMDKNKTDRKPPKGKQKRVNHPDKDGIWGRLPDKLFRLLSNRDQTVFPPEFRAFVERYFKRLAEGRPR